MKPSPFGRTVTRKARPNVNFLKKGLGRHKLVRPTKGELMRLYVRHRLSLRDVADALGMTRDTVSRALAEYGIPRRPGTIKKGKLADVPVDLLRTNVEAVGLRAHARELGVAPATLLRHLRRVQGSGLRTS